MILERSMEPGWLSNSYVVGDRPGGSAVLIDAGGPPEPIVAAIERHRLGVTHILVTHHHGDHVAHLDAMRERYGAPVLAHPLEGPRLPGGADATLGHGDVVETGDLRIEALHTPGHTDGMLAFVVNGERVLHRRHALRGLGRRRARRHGDELRGPAQPRSWTAC